LADHIDVLVGGLGLGYTAGLADDPRVRLVFGDFFALAAGDHGFGEGTPSDYDAILLDVDHTPRHVLNASHAPFYTPDGLTSLKKHLRPPAVFALWSDDSPDQEFLEVLSQVFSTARAEVVTFPNPLTCGESSNTVYVATC
jgi:spermidine synthase